MAIALMRAGKRVGVTSLSHKAIHNFLRAVQHEADQQRFSFAGAKRGTDDERADSFFASRCVVTSEDVDVGADPSFQLVAGTAWALTREAVDRHAVQRPLDVLFVDEAGQLALADVLAAGRAPARWSCSATRTSSRRSRRARTPRAPSDPCSSICSATTSPSRPTAGCSSPRRGASGPSSARSRPTRTTAGASVRAGDGIALARARERAGLDAGRARRPQPVVARRGGGGRRRGRGAGGLAVHRRRRDDTGADARRRPRRGAVQRPGAPAPERLPADVAVGTVDKFQGQQAPVVLVSMASSTPDDAPRGIGFAFDRHRFNVATSRAQCRAVLVCSPRLLDADCKTVSQMRLVSAVSSFVERSAPRVRAP